MQKLAGVIFSLALILGYASVALCEGGIAVRDSSGKALVSHGGAGDVPGLIELLKSDDGAMRSQARYALIRLGRDAVPGLVSALRRRENVPEIVYVLNSIKDDRAAGPLAELLDLKDQEALGRVEAALFSLGRPAVPYLFDAMGDNARAKAAASVLAGMKDREYLARLGGFLKEKDPAIRASAAMVERSWLDVGASGIMAGLLTDNSTAVRREATAYFLGLSPNVPTPGLGSLLKDPDEAVRVNALKIAVKDRDAGLAAGLLSVMEGDPSPEARRIAGDALYRCCPDKAVKPFIAALKDGDDSVAVSAAVHLGELDAKEAIKPLQALLMGREKPSDEVVEGVARSLGDMGEGFDPNIFLPYINWENLYVVRSVLTAWEKTARPGDVKIRAALENYVGMQVDNRYKERVKKLIERLWPKS